MYNRLLLLVVPFIFCSCLKEKDHNCPPVYRVELGISDMNYSNIAQIPGLLPKSEQLPFNSFVSNLAWQLENLATHEIVARSGEVVVDGGSRTYGLDFIDLPSASYLFTVFGNIDRLPVISENRTSYSLHPRMDEGVDTYRVSDTLDFSPAFMGKTIGMMRSKGALLVQIDNLPDSVVRVDEQIYSVYRDVYENGMYETEVDIRKSFTSGLHPETVLFTLVAPTVAGKQSVLRLGLYTAGADSPYMFIPDIPLIIKRNEITAFRMNFKLEGGVEVWINQNGSWVKYHDITLN